MTAKSKKLPKYKPSIKFDFVHQFCFYLHDIWVKLLKEWTKDKKFDTKFVDLDWIGEEDLEVYLKNHWREKEWYCALIRMMIPSLIWEFSNYIHTALVAAEKAKTSVTYSLLRKPMKDILYIIEYLVARPYECIENFMSEDGHCMLDLTSKLWKEQKLTISSEAMEKSWGHLDPAFIHDLLFDKKLDYWLEQWRSRAHHLITSFDAYKTGKWALNFVFSTKDDVESHLNHIYWLLPLLLFHYVLLIRHIWKTYCEPNPSESDLNFYDDLIPMTIWFMLSNKTEKNYQEVEIPFDDIRITCLEEDCCCESSLDNLQLPFIFYSQVLVLDCWKVVDFFNTHEYVLMFPPELDST